MESVWVDLRQQLKGTDVSVYFQGAGVLHCYLVPSWQVGSFVAGEVEGLRFDVSPPGYEVQVPSDGPWHLVMQGDGDAEVIVGSPPHGQFWSPVATPTAGSAQRGVVSAPPVSLPGGPDGIRQFNTASSLGALGMPSQLPEDIPADAQSVDLQSGEVPEGTATAVDWKLSPEDPVGPDAPEPPVPQRVSKVPSAQEAKSMTDMEIFWLSKDAEAAIRAYDAQWPKPVPAPLYPAYLEGRAPLEAVKAALDAQLSSRGVTFGPLGGEVQYNALTGSILRFRDYSSNPRDPEPPWKELGAPEPIAPTVPRELQEPTPGEPPTSVSGYRVHASQRMEERGWTRGQVEDAVDNPKQPPIFQPDKGTWLYDGQNGITVSINPNGMVVTVF